MSLSRHPHPDQTATALQVSRITLLILWSMTFVAIHRSASFLYLIPLLALITFLMLPPFPLVVAALFLSGYLDVFPIERIPDAPRLALIAATWLAALVALSAKAATSRRDTAASREHERPVANHEISVLPTSSTQKPISPVLSDATPSATLRHNISTSLNLILAFCEALLSPASASRQPLPAPFREDVETIFRNAQQLKPLVEKLLDSAASVRADESPADPSASRPRMTVIVLDEGGAAFDLFKQYIQEYELVRASSVEGIGRLRQDHDLLAVAISSDDFTLIPVIAQLVGNTVPILTFSLAEVQPQTQFHGARDYLMKPVEFAKLMAALEGTGALLRTVLIIDDNRDNVQMLSRMLNSMPEPPQLLKAYSGREALALLRDEIPDVILLDFVLPDMDGMAILDYLRTEGRLARIPVLLVSAHRPPDILPVAGVTRLTLFRLAGFSPVLLAQYIEAVLSASGSRP